MSSTCPPQLQLSIQPNTTSFKRSFEQFGFDLESPVVANSGAATAAAGDGRNERNKRARSASSFESETSSNLSSDTIASTSSSGSNAMSQGDAVEIAPTSIENPRLSTPEIEDVEMPDYTEPESVDVQREGPHGSEQYRLALGRFNEFDSEIAVLRQSPSSSTASPPTLPPLRHGVALFRHDETSASPFSSAFFDHVHPVSDSLQQPGSTSDSHFDPFQPSQTLSTALSAPSPAIDFRDRLDTALERLRSPSPLVPGLEVALGPRDAEDEEDESMAEGETELEENESIVGANAAHDPPPMLPPIRIVEDFLTTRTETPAPSTTHTLPPEPPTLPPIPVIADESVVDAAERAWRSRNQGALSDMLGLITSPEHVERSPSRSSDDIQEVDVSPRPFSRSARSAASSRHRSITTNPTLVDHFLPSPILRDLHNWLEAQEPLLPPDERPGHAFDHSVENISNSSISTIAATARARGETSTSAAPSSAIQQAGPSTASEPSSGSQQDRLSRMLDRIRTGSRAEDWNERSNRRPWLSPPASRSTASVEPDTRAVREQLPWYTGDPSPASVFGSPVSNTATATSRPISTTPAPGNSLLSPSEDAHMGSYWESALVNLPEQPFTITQHSSPLARAQTESARYSTYGPGSAADSSTNNAATTNNGDSHSTDPAAGLWSPLEPSDLPLNLSFSSALASSSNQTENSSTTLNNNTNTNHSSETSVMRQRYRPRFTGAETNFTNGLAPLPLENQRERLVREEATRMMLARQSRVRTPQSVEHLPEEERWQSLDDVWTSTVRDHPTTTRNAEPPSSADQSSLPPLRQRLLRSYSSQTRLGSFNSLVTENASEVRRRADREEVRELPTNRYSWAVLDSNMEAISTDVVDYARQTEHPYGTRSWENTLLDRIWAESRDRGTSRSEYQPRSRTTRQDTLLHDSAAATTNGRPTSPSLFYWNYLEDFEGIHTPSSENINPNPPLDPPSLPPPDLGNSFDAEHHPRSWAAMAESDVDHNDERPNASNAPESRPNNVNGMMASNNMQRNRIYNTAYPSSTAASLDGQTLDPEQQSERSTPRHQAIYQRLQRLQQLQAAPQSTSRPSALPSGSNVRELGSPTSVSTTAAPVASSPSITYSGTSRRSSARDVPARYSLFDPSAFAAGPFRNTLQHFVDEREGPSVTRSEATNQANATRANSRRPPPYIPPLSFGNENEHLFSSPRPDDIEVQDGLRYRFRRSREEITGAGNRMPPRVIRETPLESYSLARATPPLDFPARPFPSFTRPSNADDTNDDDNLHFPRRYVNPPQSSAMHRYISRQVRSEATQPEDHLPSYYSPRGVAPTQPRVETNSATVNPALRTALMIHRSHRDRVLADRVEEEDAIQNDPINALRTRSHRRRQSRAQQEAMMSFSRPPPPVPNWRRGRILGDFMRDEDFDDSYENLLSLSMQIGDAKPRGTPSNIIDKMEKGLYKDWAMESSDTRCPICLDDYNPTDPVQKLSNCSHWLHQECLTQWLHSATTCPVCRGSVNPPLPTPSLFSAQRQPRYRSIHPFGLPTPRRRRDASPTGPTPTLPNIDSSRRTNQPSNTPQSPNFGSRDNSNHNGGQGNNGPRDGSGRTDTSAPWRHRHI